MATVNFCGWETGDVREAAVNSGTVSVQTSVARNGGYALKSNPTTTGTGFHQFDGLNADGTSSGTDASIVTSYVRFYFQYTTKPASNDEPIIRIGTSAAGRKLIVRLNSAGNLAAYDAANALLATGTTVLASGVWYRIEIKCGTSATVGAYEAKIDGASEFSGTGNLSATNAGSVRLGKETDANGNTVVFYYDDFLWSDSAYPGNGQCVRMVPNGAGASSQWTATGAATDWQATNEVPHNSDTSYISDSNSGDVDVMTMTASGTIAGDTINSVKVLAIAKVPVTPGNIIVRCRSGATNSDTTGAATTTSYVTYAKLFNTDPNTGSGWTSANVNLLQAGVVQNSANVDRVTAVYAMVDFLPTTTPARTTTDAPTISESISRTFVGLRTNTDATTSSDNAARSLLLLRSTTEPPSISESTSRLFTGLRTATEAPTTSDSSSKLLSLLRQTTDAPIVSESLSSTKLLLRSTEDAFSTLEVVSRVLSALRAAADSPTTADVVTRQLAALRSSTEALGVSEVLSKSYVGSRSTLDDVSLLESLASTKTLLRSISGSIAVSESMSLSLTGERAASESIAVSGSPSRLLINTRAAADSIILSEAANKSLISFRATNDAAALSESLSRVAQLVRVAVESLTISEALAGLRSIPRDLSDSILLSDTAGHGQAIFCTTGEVLSLSEIVSHIIPIVRNVVESISLSESPIIQKQLLREANDSMLIAEAVLIQILHHPFRIISLPWQVSTFLFSWSIASTPTLSWSKANYTLLWS